jgi:hypothetical protein
MNKTFSKIALVTILLAQINPVFAVTSIEASKSELDYQPKSEGIVSQDCSVVSKPLLMMLIAYITE